MTPPKTRLIGATAIATLALAGALVAWQASSDSPADLAQLSDDDKLEILNSGDADAISELLEAEEAAAQAHFARERLERQKREAEIDVERAEARARGAAYWDSFDPDSIDLTGFDFALAKLSTANERRARIAELPIATGFDRANEVAYPRSKFDCNAQRYGEIRELLDREAKLTVSVDQHDVARVSDYLSHRAALETGDCSCATLTGRPEQAWDVIKILAVDPSIEQFRGQYARAEAMNIMGILLGNALEAEMRQFCERS